MDNRASVACLSIRKLSTRKLGTISIRKLGTTIPVRPERSEAKSKDAPSQGRAGKDQRFPAYLPQASPRVSHPGARNPAADGWLATPGKAFEGLTDAMLMEQTEWLQRQADTMDGVRAVCEAAGAVGVHLDRRNL